jgi:hypothetical protein
VTRFLLEQIYELQEQNSTAGCSPVSGCGGGSLHVSETFASSYHEQYRGSHLETGRSTASVVERVCHPDDCHGTVDSTEASVVAQLYARSSLRFLHRVPSGYGRTAKRTHSCIMSRLLHLSLTLARTRALHMQNAL